MNDNYSNSNSMNNSSNINMNINIINKLINNNDNNKLWASRAFASDSLGVRELVNFPKA